MGEKRPPDVGGALELGGKAGRIREFYRDWADTYDADLEEEGYFAPAICASLATLTYTAYLGGDRRTTTIMDAGCGTGLTGVAMRRAGFARIDGFDIAPAMVDAARETGAYGTLTSDVDLNAADAGLSALGGRYAIITSSGVFTLGHVAPHGLYHLFSLAAPGGFVIISTRDGYLAESGFEDFIAGGEAEGRFALIQRLRGARYVGADTADYWVFRKPSRRA